MKARVLRAVTLTLAVILTNLVPHSSTVGRHPSASASHNLI